MGDPRKFRKKYTTPSHPWNKQAIDAEKILVREFGLAKKQEIYSANSFIKKYRQIAKGLIVNKSAQGEKEKLQIMGKLARLGLLPAGAALSDVLGLETKDLLERRLQTIVYKKGLARSVKQARQFITHRHVMVGDKEITAPSYLVSKEEEAQITFKNKSALSSEDHPERVDPNQDIKEEVAEIKKEAAEVKENKETPVIEEKTEASKAEEKTEIEEVAEAVEKEEEAQADVVEKVSEAPQAEETPATEVKVEESESKEETKVEETKVEEAKE